jgi:hypothetical protein
MPLIKDSSNRRNTYINISKGKFYTKESGKDPVFYGELEGYINGLNFKNDVYNGKEFEILQLSVSDDTENFILQMRVDSGYFRSFCNALKSGNIFDKFRFSPFYSEENGKPRTVLFLKQNSIPLKFYHTQKNMGDLPPLEKIMVRGQEIWDGTKQINYWKNFLLSLNFLPPIDESIIPKIEASHSSNAPSEKIEHIDDDLPF